MDIEWLLSGTASTWAPDDYRDGGAVYETYVRKVLGGGHNILVTYTSRGSHSLKIVRFFQFGLYILRNCRRKYRAELVIRDLFSTVFAPFDSRRKNVVIIHHLDFSSVGNRTLYRWIRKRFFKRVRLADAVVVVSEHWKKILERVGCAHVEVIYNAFDLEIVNFDPAEITEFRGRLGIAAEKPIIYLGNARSEKGYLEAYDALRGIDAVFVATGRQTVPPGIRQFFLSYPDYLKLLGSSSLALTMSKFNEGWCRTAHEAMLCGTPVIGSGRGGMKELLESGGQVVCRDFSRLKPLVTDLLNDQERLKRMGQAGRGFARAFSLDYLETGWNRLIESVGANQKIRKIVHLTHNIELYGVFMFLVHLTKAERQRRELSPAIVVNPGHKNLDRFRANGVFVHRLRRASAKDPGSFISFLSYFRGYDIVNLHTYSPWAILAAALLGKKVVYTFHGAFGFKGSGTDWLKKKFYRSIINRLSNKIVFASPTSSCIYQERTGAALAAEKTALLPFGLDIDTINATRSASDVRADWGAQNSFLVGTVARIDRVKRFERLIEAFSYLPRHEHFRLLIVGNGDADYREELQAEVERHGLRGAVQFLGYRTDVFDVVKALDFFVLPSAKETFGLALLEAMALGVPSAIFHDAGGALDIIGDAGFIVGSPRELGEVILRIKSDEGLRRRTSDRLRLRARQFDIRVTAEKYSALYEALGQG